MTDEPMDATEHPDEGLIHAWLDDALDAAEAERLAAHVRTCAECQGRVAEARGLIAGASRVVAALDGVPAGTRPGWAQSAVGGGAVGGAAPASASRDPSAQGSLWRWLKVTPGRAALAATILVAIGITVTYERTAVDYPARTASSVFDPQKSDRPAATSPEGGASDGAKPRDPLLDSAVARNVTIAQGKRTMEAATGPVVPQAPPPRTTLEAPANSAAGQAVALGRASAEARRESATVLADRSRAGFTGAVAAVPEPTSAASSVGASEPTRAPAAAPRSQQAASDAMVAKTSSGTVARSCLMLESPDADARWADQPFPLVLAIEPGSASGPRDAAVLTPNGGVTSLRAQWSPRGGDSVLVRLRRIGYSGSIVLGPEAGARTGTAVSSTFAATEEMTVATGYGTQAPARADEARAAARRAAPAPAAPAPAPAAAAGPPVRQLRVTARSIACPAS
jgi:hypothetical protein